MRQRPALQVLAALIGVRAVVLWRGVVNARPERFVLSLEVGDAPFQNVALFRDERVVGLVGVYVVEVLEALEALQEALHFLLNASGVDGAASPRCPAPATRARGSVDDDAASPAEPSQ